MNRYFWGMMLLLGAFVLQACSTRLLESWSDPSITSEFRFKKIVVVVINKNSSIQQAAENALVSHIKRSEAVASHTLIPEQQEVDNVIQLKTQWREAGFDGVVVMRVVGVEEELDMVTEAHPVDQETLVSYWDTSYKVEYDQEYSKVVRFVEVETKIYSLVEDRLLYSARTESIDPDEVQYAVGKIAKTIAADLRKKGLLP